MSDRERAIQLLEEVPDYKIKYVIAYLQGVTAGEDEPNLETKEAMRELEEGNGEEFKGSTSKFLQMMLED